MWMAKTTSTRRFTKRDGRSSVEVTGLGVEEGQGA